MLLQLGGWESCWVGALLHGHNVVVKVWVEFPACTAAAASASCWHMEWGAAGVGLGRAY